MDIRVGVSFDGNDGIAFTQGEDRTILIAVYDADTLLPVNLTGGVIGINFPRQGGGSIKRTNGSVIASAQNVNLNPANTVVITDHGLVTGDVVQVAPIGGGTLPAGLAISTNYTIAVVDNNTIGFLTSLGVVVDLTTQGIGTFSLTDAADLVLTTPASGLATLNLRAAVSEDVQPCENQAFQVEYTVSGKTRIAVVKGTLDVQSQPDP